MTAHELQRAELISRRMNPVFSKMWCFMWPRGHCAVASLCLAPLLRASMQTDFRVVIGRANDCQMHAWIESPEGDVVDPTYGQFDNGYPLRVLSASGANELGHCGEIKLTLEQEETLRNTIEPKNYHNKGWSAKSAVRTLFSDHPRIINIQEEEHGSR